MENIDIIREVIAEAMPSCYHSDGSVFESQGALYCSECQSMLQGEWPNAHEEIASWTPYTASVQPYPRYRHAQQAAGYRLGLAKRPQSHPMDQGQQRRGVCWLLPLQCQHDILPLRNHGHTHQFHVLPRQSAG